MLSPRACISLRASGDGEASVAGELSRAYCQMLPNDILTLTPTVTSGMQVRDVFRHCLHTRVQALPFCDEEDRITGRVTLKYIINQSILPEYMAELAHLLGPRMTSFEDLEGQLAEVFARPVEPYVQEPHASIPRRTPLMKALAVMEHHDTSYLFVVEDRRYQGTLTITGIATWMLKLVEKA